MCLSMAMTWLEAKCEVNLNLFQLQRGMAPSQLGLLLSGAGTGGYQFARPQAEFPQAGLLFQPRPTHRCGCLFGCHRVLSQTARCAQIFPMPANLPTVP